jgi:hypothetical protein
LSLKSPPTKTAKAHDRPADTSSIYRPDIWEKFGKAGADRWVSVVVGMTGAFAAAAASEEFLFE